MSTQNFAGQNLRGRSFKGQDLTGADFSDCDLRGVDFSGANLTAVKFCRAKMGYVHSLQKFILLSQLLTGLFSSFLLACWAGFLSLRIKFGLEGLGVSEIEHIPQATMLLVLALSGAVWWGMCYQRWRYFVMALPWFITIMGFAVVMGGGALYLSSAEVAATFVFGTVLIVLVIVSAIALAVLGYVALAGAGIVAVIAMIAMVGYVSGIWVGVFFVLSSIYLERHTVMDEDAPWVFLRRFDFFSNALFCTRFCDTQLQRTDFTEANLNRADFRGARFLDCRFEGAKNHHLAMTEGTPLEIRKVRELVVNSVVTETDFHGLNLQGLDFSGLDLRGFNFANSNLSFANFSGCDLREANLSEVTALGTRFNEAELTGACIQNWNIDTRTELNQIRCDFVYLTDGKQQRNPPDSDFAAGEFSKLYQQVADTIDFIVHSRAELTALVSAIDTVKTEAGNADIFVQNIERKDDSVILKLKAPPEFDREQIYKEVRKEQKKEIKRLKSQYEQQLLNQRTEFKQEKDQLLGLLQTSLQRPVTVNNQLENNLMKEDSRQDNSRSFSGNGNQNVNLGDNSTLSQTIQHLPAEQGELKALLLALQTLIPQLPDVDQPKALAKAEAIVEATTKPKEEQQNIVKKSVKYFKDLAEDLSDLPEIGKKLGVLAAQIAALYCL